jgi:hypothetical protein
MKCTGTKHGGRIAFLICAVVLLLSACDQYPIFDAISGEVKPREPRIRGVPSKIVVFEYERSKWGMYVADSSLHRYAKNGNGAAVWDEGNIPQPPGKIFDLAATNNALYALTDVDSPRLYCLRQGSDAAWAEVVIVGDNQGYSRFQSIYGETDSEGKPQSNNLYVGASKAPSKDGKHYAVFHTDGTDRLQLLIDNTSLLSGAASDGTNHYFSTAGDGVYHLSATSPRTFIPTSGTAKLEVRGLILLPTSVQANTVLALCYNGDLHSLSGGSAQNPGNAGVNLTGPAAVWNENGKTLLLAAARNSTSSTSSTYGYRELDISAGWPSVSTMKEPGADPSASTMESNNLYHTTIEPKPVNAILRAPSEIDDGKTLFASVRGQGTAKDNTDGGLWSYRRRDNVMQWNAEE